MSPKAGLILSSDGHMRATKTAIRTLTLMPNCDEEKLGRAAASAD
jgi:hypothetical protein